MSKRVNLSNFLLKTSFFCKRPQQKCRFCPITYCRNLSDFSITELPKISILNIGTIYELFLYFYHRAKVLFVKSQCDFICRLYVGVTDGPFMPPPNMS